MACLFFLTACALTAPGELTLAQNGVSPYTIVIAAEAPAPDQTAAKELQSFVKQVTGAELPIAASAPAGRPRLVVGDGPAFRALCPETNLAKLGHDGIVIRTVGQDLVLAGRAPRGTLYAVYSFLEDTVGCRWWTSTESTIPQRPTLTIPAQNVNYAPALRCREAFYKDAFQGVFAARCKFNGHFEQVPPEYGGHYRILGWCHTFDQLLPPAKYFADHPEWYSEIGGKRSADRTQLCLTNDAMRAELTKVALAWIRKEPTAGMISISQNDWHGRCECANCKAVEDEEGGASGPLIRFVNAVAEEIEQEFPDFLIETLAYQYTRQPPQRVKPRANVVIRLCTIECSYIQPLAKGPQNEQFAKDIAAWSAIAPNLYIWDYVTNFANFLLPQPNLRVLAPNIRTFVDNHTIGLFEQGDAYSTIGDFIRLRAWVLAHLEWDPSRDEQALIDEFLNGYYGAAGPPLRQYLDLLHDAAEQSGVYLRCYMNDTAGWLDLKTATAAQHLLDQAAAAVAGEPVLAKRVERETLPLQLVWLDRHAVLKRQAKQQGVAFAGPADGVAAFERWLALANEHGNQFYGEGRPFDGYATALQARFRPPGPPPEPCQGLPEEDWLDAQDNLLTLHGLGSWVTIVDDPAASDGKTARMPGSHNQWAVQWPFSDDLDDGSTWRVFVSLRCEATAAEGLALAIGVYDTAAKKGLMQQDLSIEATAGPEYKLIDLGAHKLKAGIYVWVAPRSNPEQVTAVYVDRMFVVREK